MSKGSRELITGGTIVDMAADLPEAAAYEEKVVTRELGDQVAEIVKENGEELDTGEEALPDMDFHDEMIQVEMLFQSHILSFGYKEYTLENYADKKFFGSWKAREGCRDTDEMRAGLNIDGILRSGSPSEGEVLTYLQYVLNIAELCRRSFNREEAEGYDFDIRNYTLLLSRIREMLKQLRYDYRYVEAKEFIFIVPHDVTADAAIPDIPSNPLYGALTEYRSTSAAGDLKRKRALLTAMGRTIESYPDNLREGHNVLYSHIEFLLNHVHIRNNNREGDDRIDRIAGMADGELEDWYDEAYRMLLVRILEHENAERMERVDQLAAECGSSIESVTAEEINSIMNGFPTEEEERIEEHRQAVSAERLYEMESPESSRSTKDRHVVPKTMVAVVLADVLFFVFLMYYYHLI